MTELSVKNLKNKILKGVSLAMKPGEIICLLGPSGSGKTTLLRTIAGLEKPTSGVITIGNNVVYDSERQIDVPVEKRELALMFQSYALWPHKSVFDNIAYGLTLRGVKKQAIKEKVDEVLQKLTLKGLEGRYPHELSGGQQQRVALARSLVYQPKILLLDEPLSNLDAKLREEARAWLRILIQDLNLSSVWVTHDQTEAMAISDTLILLNEGKVEQAGTPQEVYNHPNSYFAADFMGNNNILEGRIVTPSTIEINGQNLFGKPYGTRGVALIRLEAITVSTTPSANSLALPLITSMYLGDHFEHLFRQGTLTVRAFGKTALPPGDYWLHLPKEKLWIF